MNATILLKEMEYEVKIGVEENEQLFPQQVLFDIEIRLDITNAVEKEDIEQTINYSDIQREIAIFLKNKKYKLVEKLTNDVVRMLIEKFPNIEEITLTCWKSKALAKKKVKNVGIKITKYRSKKQAPEILIR